MSCGLYLLLKGDVQHLSAVYSLAFMSVMSLFAFGDMMLKYKVAWGSSGSLP